MIFVKSLEGKTPVEKIEEIESFVKSIGVYDFDNGEVMADKEGKPIGEVINIMSQRMDELKLRSTDKDAFKHKKFAGVCADFAKLTTALLREAGFPSGIMTGFQPGHGETTVSVSNAHAISYVLWPAEDNKVRLITLDGTPGGSTPEEEAKLMGIRQKSLKERMQAFSEQEADLLKKAEKELEELERIMKDLDEDAIKLLENGQLERTLNFILNQVRESHLSVIDRVLNASRYAGFDATTVADKNNIEAEIAFRQFMEKEIASERAIKKDDDHFRGEKLVRSLAEFMTRYAKDDNVGGKAKALQILERIFDISKTNLNPIESRSAIAVLTYLKAKRMGSK